MTPRAKYIAHCESLGIHKSLAGLMADECRKKALLYNSITAVGLLFQSFAWADTRQGHDFWSGVCCMLEKMAIKGECK